MSKGFIKNAFPGLLGAFFFFFCCCSSVHFLLSACLTTVQGVPEDLKLLQDLVTDSKRALGPNSELPQLKGCTISKILDIALKPGDRGSSETRVPGRFSFIIALVFLLFYHAPIFLFSRCLYLHLSSRWLSICLSFSASVSSFSCWAVSSPPLYW